MSSLRRLNRARWQYQPTRTFHDPAPPLALENVTPPIAWMAEVLKTSPDLHPVLTLNLPGGVVKRYTTEGYPVSSDSLGTIAGKVTSWPSWTRAVSDPQGGLKSVSLNVEISDLDRSLEPIFEGAYARQVPGSVVTIDYLSSALGFVPGDLRRFAGRIVSAPLYAGDLKWRLTLRSNDDALRANRLPFDAILSSDFPLAADPKIFGQPNPIIMGVHDSRDGTLAGAHGALPAYNVVRDTAGGVYRYLLGVGALAHVERIFNGGTVVSGANWSRKTYAMPGFNNAPGIPTGYNTTPPFRGRLMSFIELTVDPGAGAVITWDGIGLTRSGLGYLGSNSWWWYPLTNPAHQLRILLNEFVLPDTPWRNGPWSSWSGSVSSDFYSRGVWKDHALLDSASFDALASWFEKRGQGYRGSLWLGGSFTDGRQVLQDFCASHGVAVYPTAAGKLGVKPWDPGKKTVYYSGAGQWWRAYDMVVPGSNPVVTEQDPAEIATEVSAETFKVASESTARTILSVRDPSVARVSRHLAAVPTDSGKTARRWGAAFPRFMGREYLDSPTALYYADDLDTVSVDGGGLGAQGWKSSKALGTPINLTQGTAGLQPKLKLGAVNGRPSVVFDGVDDVLLSATPLSSFIQNNIFHLAFAIKATANGGSADDASPWLNPAVITDAGGTWGLSQRLIGDQNYLQGWLWNGTIAQTVKIPIELNRWYVVTWVLDTGGGGAMYLVKNLFALGGMAGVGPVNSLVNNVHLGKNYNSTAWWAGELYAVVIQNNDAGNEGSGGGRFPGGWWYMVAEMLADAIGLSESQWL